MSFSDPFFVSIYEDLDGLRSEDVQYYLERAANAEGPILDAGCGSGRLLLPMLSAGLDAYGFDASPIMIEKLEQGLIAETGAERVWVDSLQDFPGRGLPAFSLIICTFNTFLHVLSQDEQLKVLENFYNALAPDGVLLLDIISPMRFAILDDASELRVFEGAVTNENGDAIQIWRWFDRDLVAQLGTYNREYRVTSKDGTERSEHSLIDFRWTFPNEMELLLRHVGFPTRDVYGDFDGGPLTETSDVQIWRARK
jgi:SAM-dependent methyltransferase